MASVLMNSSGPSFPSSAGFPDTLGGSTFGAASSAPAARSGAGLQHRLASLVQQLAGLQQHSLDTGAGMATSYPADPMQQAAGALARTTTNAGAVLRSLSTGNPRVLALAAAAAKAPYGTLEHAAVLSALKDEIMQASNIAPACTQAPGAQAAAEGPNLQGAGPQQQQQLTQDALWAALMAKAAARTGGSNPSSPRKGSKQPQQQLSPQPLPGHASTDSVQEAAEGTSCALPWALLQAAQQAQQEEEEKEAAAAAAAAAGATVAAAAASPAASEEAAAAHAAASTPSPMAVDAAEAVLGSPAKDKSHGLVRSGSTVLFKRRHVNNSNVLQRHFSRPAASQPAAQPLARTQSEAATVPKPQHTFKKQLRKKPLVMRGSSSSNLALLQQLSQQQQQSAAASTEPECSAEAGVTGSQYAALADNAPTLSNASLRAPAATAPAAMGGPGFSDVMGFLACRKQQLQALQEQLQLHRRRMTPSAGELGWLAMSGLSGYAGGFAGTPTGSTAAGPCSPAQSKQAVSELQRLLSSMDAAAGPNSAAAAAAAAAGVAPALPTADTADTEMQDLGMHYEAGAAAAAALLAQAKYRLSQQQAQQECLQEEAHASTAPPHALSTIKEALAAALSAAQQRQQQAFQPAAATGYAGGGSNNDLLRQLAAALQANK